MICCLLLLRLRLHYLCVFYVDEENSDDLWQQVGEDIAPANSNCGSAVDISNDGKTIIVGCPGTDVEDCPGNQIFTSVLTC